MTSLEIDAVAMVKPLTLRDQVYEQVRKAIIECRLRPGDDIREQELTRQLGVSRTPLREALGLLERDGLVRNYPNRGWFVVEFTEQDIDEVFTIRCELENLAASLWVGKSSEEQLDELERLIAAQADAVLNKSPDSSTWIDIDFHRHIVGYGGNQRLLELWEKIAAQCVLAFSYKVISNLEINPIEFIDDHTAILEALRSGDIERVRRVNSRINTRVAEHAKVGCRFRQATASQ